MKQIENRDFQRVKTQGRNEKTQGRNAKKTNNTKRKQY